MIYAYGALDLLKSQICNGRSCSSNTGPGPAAAAAAVQYKQLVLTNGVAGPYTAAADLIPGLSLPLYHPSQQWTLVSPATPQGP